MPSAMLAKTIRKLTVPARQRWPEGPMAFLQETREVGTDKFGHPRDNIGWSPRNVGNQNHKRSGSGSRKGRRKKRKNQAQRKEEERSIEARIAYHSAKFEPLRAKIVKLLVEYGWVINTSQENRTYGLLEIRKNGFMMLVETSGFERLYRHLLKNPEAWGYIDWMDSTYGSFPLPYYLNQSIMESWTMVQQEKDELARLIADAIQASRKSENVFVRFQPTWAALAIIGAIFFAGWQAKSFISTEVRTQVAPLKDEISKGFENVNYSFNGNPATGAKGINERLGAMEAKLDR